MALANMDSPHNSQIPLLRLPAELRDRIWRYAAVSFRDIWLGDRYDRGLLGTCRQTRREALKIYYYENTFFANIGRIPKVGNPKVVTRLFDVVQSLDLTLDVRPLWVRVPIADLSAVHIEYFGFRGVKWDPFLMWMDDALPDQITVNVKEGSQNLLGG